MNIALTSMTRLRSTMTAGRRVVAVLCIALVSVMHMSACKRPDPSEHPVQYSPVSTSTVAFNISPVTDQLIVSENIVAVTSNTRSSPQSADGVVIASALKRPSYARHGGITVTHMPVSADLKTANPLVGNQITVKM